MAHRELPSQEDLRQSLVYDPFTGTLFWRPRDASEFAAPAALQGKLCNIWNKRYAGKPAIHAISANGYREGPFKGVRVKAHRVIWKLVTGSDPDQVDHINGDRSDNRFDNLRNVSNTENQKNAKRRKDNTSSHVGVYLYPHERKTPKWLARLGSKHIGYFDTFDEAVAARKAAELSHGFHPNHGRAA